MAKLGFSPEKTMEMDMDIVESFVALHDLEYRMEWKMRAEILRKVFGGK